MRPSALCIGIRFFKFHERLVLTPLLRHLDASAGESPKKGNAVGRGWKASPRWGDLLCEEIVRDALDKGRGRRPLCENTPIMGIREIY